MDNGERGIAAARIYSVDLPAHHTIAEFVGLFDQQTSGSTPPNRSPFQHQSK
jgi:hypothetical protein